MVHTDSPSQHLGVRVLEEYMKTLYKELPSVLRVVEDSLYIRLQEEEAGRAL